ncbi:MAG: class I SAM-dependent methyltransferase [Polyangiales bacterium]
MSELAERFRERYFGEAEHPYRTFEREVERLLRTDHTLLDAGCGREAPILQKYRSKARRLIGVELVALSPSVEGIEFYQTDIAKLPLEDASVDLVMSRSVMEHIEDPLNVYRELNRVMKPGGHFVFLTANFWDYAAIIASVVPNRFHPWIVAKTEGRAEEDVFPTRYRTNTRVAVRRWANATGFEIVSFRYLGQYPSYFMFNGLLFLLATGYEKLVSKVQPLNFLQGWILAVLRKGHAVSQDIEPSNNEYPLSREQVSNRIACLGGTPNTVDAYGVQA